MFIHSVGVQLLTIPVGWSVCWGHETLRSKSTPTRGHQEAPCRRWVAKASPAWPRSAAGREPGGLRKAHPVSTGEAVQGSDLAGADRLSSPPGSGWGTHLLNETEGRFGVFGA